jgi:FlhB HrpN YscU SpaS Family
MADATGQERTEKATGKRRMEARKRGQVAISREIPSTLILFTLLGVFAFAGPHVLDQLTRLVAGMFGRLNAIRVHTLGDAGSISPGPPSCCWRRSACRCWWPASSPTSPRSASSCTRRRCPRSFRN